MNSWPPAEPTHSGQGKEALAAELQGKQRGSQKDGEVAFAALDRIAPGPDALEAVS